MGNLHNKRVFPYKTLLVLFSSLLSLIYISLIGLQCYTATSNYLQNHFSLQEKSALSQATQTMNEQLSRTKTLAEMLSKDNASLAALAAYDAAGAKEKLEVQRHISSLLYAMRVVNPNITSLAVFTEKSVLTMGDCTLYGGDRKGFRRTFPEMKAETETVFHVPEKESSPEQTPYRDLADRTFFFRPAFQIQRSGLFLRHPAAGFF